MNIRVLALRLSHNESLADAALARLKLSMFNHH